MAQDDATQAFLDSLPEVKPGESFRFACHPGVKCFNACCGDLTLMLTPFDVMRLRRNLALSSREFLASLADVSVAPDTGFPLLRLRMTDAPGKPCPFVRREGCSVYPDRPGACRTYPIGRASRLDAEGGIIEQFFLVREPHCKGFDEDKDWTPGEWLSDQGLKIYNAANDRYVRLLARQKKSGAAIDHKKATMVLMALYQLDNFRSFVKDMGLFKRLDVDAERQEKVLAEDEAALDFALDWVELALFGDAEGLSRKG
ncbi:protein of unknown function UPF0153 [Desulfovibrio sp. X2]|uniref:YkgJ family cysteine cluster protein n=1 Tax=Desulfovibrio sp. X2 TaxID=941449 RepID=UPI000358756A|nr:YkgJ family cysteine cluster protein [Desulfovibrio sp. X2]EPR37496.1 protein of unknown function UPF0153 [Desulfovibrio sp. X2]